MPGTDSTPNQFRHRVKDPGGFKEGSFRTKKLKNGVSIIIGKPNGSDSMTVQSYHFDKTHFKSKDDVHKWLGKNKVSKAMENRFIEKVRALLEIKRSESKKKLDPNAKVRNRGNVVFPAGSSKVKDHKDHFPINNANQARNALSRVAQYSSVPPWYSGSLESLKSAVQSAVKRKYPTISVTKGEYTVAQDGDDDDENPFAGPLKRYGGGQVPDKKKKTKKEKK